MPAPEPLVTDARRLWAEQAGHGGPFEDGVTVVVSPQSQLCPDGFVGVVSIGAGVLATVPTDGLAAPVREVLTTVTVDEATTPAPFAEAFDVPDVLGPAALAYVDTRSFRPAPARDGWGLAVVDPGSPELMAFVNRCPEDDADESGLADATAPVSVVLDEGGAVIAACGWRVWSGTTAHVGVLTAPAARGQGAGRAAASAAVERVLAAGLLPQWRARIPASRAVAAALGFHELGAQLSLRVTARTPDAAGPSPTVSR